MVHEEKIPYVYLEQTNPRMMNVVFLDKSRVIYKPLNEQVMKVLTWHGLLILEPAPWATPLKQMEMESAGWGEKANPTSTLETLEFEKDEVSYRLPTKPTNWVKPSAPPLTKEKGFSTLKSEKTRSPPQEVHKKAIPSRSIPTVKFLGIDEDVSGFTLGIKSFDHQEVWPSSFQNWVKKYNGLGDPYNHLASFKQVVWAEQVNDFHTKVEGFGLTLEWRALSWLQTLNVTGYPIYKALEKDFIVAFSRTGLKHDVLSQIHGFKQKSDKMVRDGANPLRQYLARCPEEEMTSQERLVSIFLEGLRNNNLHASLYMKHHKNLNHCVNDVIDYDDNCVNNVSKENQVFKDHSTTSGSVTSQIEEIDKGVMEKM